MNRVKNFWNRFNCAPAKWALEKERRREGECLTLPLNLFKKQWPYLFLPVVVGCSNCNVNGNFRCGTFDVECSKSKKMSNVWSIRKIGPLLTHYHSSNVFNKRGSIMCPLSDLKSPKKTFECHVPYWILAVKSNSIKFWYKVLTTHIHKWCQATFWQNWVEYITGIYGKMWFWKWRIKLSWLTGIKFNFCLILWTPLLLVLSAVRFEPWHSKVVLQSIHI